MSERDENIYSSRRAEDGSPAGGEEILTLEAEDLAAEQDQMPETAPASAPEKPEESGKESSAGDASEELDTFDYVMPRESFRKYHRHHRHKHKHRKKTKENPNDASWEESAQDFVFLAPKKKKHHHKHHHHHHHHHRHHHRRRKRRRMKRWKKVLLIILSVILGITIVLAGTFMVLREIGRKSLHNYDELQITVPTEVESGKEVVSVDKYGRVINYDGVSYAFNDNVLALTLIGIDDGTGSESGERMADAIYVLAVDTTTGKVRVLGISRDTMTDVDVYSGSGKYIDTENRQITYSYAYSGDGVTGGANTNKSISRLFYGLPMNEYVAINLDALKYLNDAIGGVTLTSSMTFVSPEDGRTIYEGETVTLHGEEAERYVRARDTQVLTSNNDRMKRQQEYIRAFLNSIVPAAKKDITVVGRLFSAISDNSESTLDMPEVTYIASTALSFLRGASDIEYVTLSGEITAGDHAELRPKNEDLVRTMLDLFYKPIATLPTDAESAETLPAESRVPETKTPATKPAQ